MVEKTKSVPYSTLNENFINHSLSALLETYRPILFTDYRNPVISGKLV